MIGNMQFFVESTSLIITVGASFGTLAGAGVFFGLDIDAVKRLTRNF